MKRDSRRSYFRLLARVTWLVGRKAPLPLLAMAVVDLGFVGTEVLVFHLLESVLSALALPTRWSEIAGAIVLVGLVILAREFVEAVHRPIAAYLGGKGTGVADRGPQSESRAARSRRFRDPGCERAPGAGEDGARGSALDAGGVPGPDRHVGAVGGGWSLPPFARPTVGPGRSLRLRAPHRQSPHPWQPVLPVRAQDAFRCRGSSNIWSAA